MYKKIAINYKDLNPYLSSKTIDIHYNKHYLNYLLKLNDVLNYLNFDYKYNISELVLHIDEFPLEYRDTILYNAGGVLNHELFFKNLSKNNNLEKNELYLKIEEYFGSFDKFVSEFKNKANLLVGSGYTFLVLNRDNKLLIINVSNQDTPYSYSYLPILNIDLWEHSYYLDYYNNRSKYIDDFFSMIDLSLANEEYKKVIKKTQN